MAPVAINFDKTLQERLEDYLEIFRLGSEAGDEASISENSISFCSMKEFWGKYLNVVSYPKGWKAIWRVPIEKCLVMDLKRPSSVLVKVISINWEKLAAEVQILKINQHDVPSSKKIAVLSDLFPVEEQTVYYDPWLLANELDKYRFFIENLWYPWDEIEDDVYKWAAGHLEQRIQLLHDMVSGVVNSEDSERMKLLIDNARHVQVELEETGRIIEELEESDDLKDSIDLEDLDELNASIDQICMHEQVHKKKEAKEEMMVRLLLLRRKLDDIQHEFEALENPVLRKAMANVKLRSLRGEYKMNHGEYLDDNCNEGKEQEEEIKNVALVYGISDLKEIRGFLDYAEAKYSGGAKCAVASFSNLQVAIDMVNPKNTSYVVSPGIHYMESTADLLSPGTTLAGVPEGVGPVPSVIRGLSLGKTMMVVNWFKDQFLPMEKQESACLENLHFNVIGIEGVLFVDCGCVCMKFCNFFHEEGHPDLPVIGARLTHLKGFLPAFSHHSSNWKEIQSGYGESCSFPMTSPISAGFDSLMQQAIAVSALGKLEATECNFKGLHTAIIARTGATVTLSKCRFSQCQVAVKIFRGAKVTAEKCVFACSFTNAVQYYAGTIAEQDDEIKKIMNGKEEVIQSSEILQRIPGVEFKECIFISGDKPDVCLMSLDEVAKSSILKETSCGAERTTIEENDKLSLGFLHDSDEDSIIVLDDD